MRSGKKTAGQPTKYTPEVGLRICERLSDGASLRNICRAEGIVNRATVYRWLEKHPEFRDQYARAREFAADAMADDILEIADDATGDFVVDDEGNRKLNPENIQRSRLRVDARKWTASKPMPKKYGDRLDMNHGVQPGDPLASLIKAVQGTSIRPGGGVSSLADGENSN